MLINQNAGISKKALPFESTVILPLLQREPPGFFLESVSSYSLRRIAGELKVCYPLIPQKCAEKSTLWAEKCFRCFFFICTFRVWLEKRAIWGHFFGDGEPSAKGVPNLWCRVSVLRHNVTTPCNVATAISRFWMMWRDVIYPLVN